MNFIAAVKKLDAKMQSYGEVFTSKISRILVFLAILQLTLLGIVLVVLLVKNLLD